MGFDDIESRPAVSTLSEEGTKAHIEVGRENIHNAIAPHESYEGRHRYDPHVEWTPAEEKAVVRRTDLYLLSWLCVMVCGLVPKEFAVLTVNSSSVCSSTEATSAMLWPITCSKIWN
jgi:hypothetical protein